MGLHPIQIVRAKMRGYIDVVLRKDLTSHAVIACTDPDSDIDLPISDRTAQVGFGFVFGDTARHDLLEHVGKRLPIGDIGHGTAARCVRMMIARQAGAVPAFRAVALAAKSILFAGRAWLQPAAPNFPKNICWRRRGELLSRFRSMITSAQTTFRQPELEYRAGLIP
jgi:hypothetical protein